MANAELETEVAGDSRGLTKGKSVSDIPTRYTIEFAHEPFKQNLRTILFSSALAEHDQNITEAPPIRHALPIIVKDTANPFIAPTAIPSPTEQKVIPSSSKSSSKAAQKPNEPIQLEQALPSSKQPSRKDQQSHMQQSNVSVKKSSVERQAEITTAPVERETARDFAPDQMETRRKEEDTIRSAPAPGVIPSEINPSAKAVLNATPIHQERDEAVQESAKSTPAVTSLNLGSTSETTPPAVEVQIQHEQATMSLPEFRDSVATGGEQDADVPSENVDMVQQETNPTDDYSVPLKDDDVTLQLPSSPKTTMGTSAKSVFSPSAVTFAALPTRDLQRGRSIGASKHARMTSHLVESTVPEVQATVKTPGPATTVALPQPSETKGAISKAARDSKSGGTGAGSSWISRKVLAGSGGEDLRKSLAASKRPSTMHHAMDEESDKEADELDDHPRQLVARASEAPVPVQRFSIASKTPQPPQQSRQTLGASAISRPVEPSQTNLSKMIADLQERRAVATFNASVTRATLPSLQLGRGAQGIAAMGISSGLLGRAALQASLDRSRTADSQGPQADTFDVFDENPYGTPKSSALKSTMANAARAQGEPSTTEELNQAVDEILRKISTERQMQQAPDVEPVTMNSDKADTELASTLQAREPSVRKASESTTPMMPRISKTRAEEQEVEELTKRTNAMSVTSRESAGRDAASLLGLARQQNITVSKESEAIEIVEYTPEKVPASTTPVNSPPKMIYRASHGRSIPTQILEAPPKPARAEETAPIQQRQATTASGPKPASAAKPLPSKTQERQVSKSVNKFPTAQGGLSQSQAVSIDSDESDDSMDESVFEDALGDKRFDEDEVLADEVAKLAKPLHLNSAEQSSRQPIEDSDSDTASVQEIESNDAGSRAPVSASPYASWRKPLTAFYCSRERERHPWLHRRLRILCRFLQQRNRKPPFTLPQILLG